MTAGGVPAGATMPYQFSIRSSGMPCSAVVGTSFNCSRRCGEVMAMLEIAMLGKLTYPVLREAIFAHPTLSEGLNTLFFDLP